MVLKINNYSDHKYPQKHLRWRLDSKHNSMSWNVWRSDSNKWKTFEYILQNLRYYCDRPKKVRIDEAIHNRMEEEINNKMLQLVDATIHRGIHAWLNRKKLKGRRKDPFPAMHLYQRVSGVCSRLQQHSYCCWSTEVWRNIPIYM